MTSMNRNTGSFRDPSGHVYEDGNRILRSVNSGYREDFEYFQSSGLADFLIEKGWILPFKEIDAPIPGSWKTLEVPRLPLISYPYEWSIGQLRAAAVLTLRIQQEALRHGMVLKDATAYNVQFFEGRPVFIDLLSFERYQPGTPWNAYKQFVSFFLGPLLLMSLKDVRYGLDFRNYLDGFPLDFVSQGLPWHTRWSPSLYIHIHWHAAMLRKYEDTRDLKNRPISTKSLSQKGLEHLIESLLDCVKHIRVPKLTTEWGDYYNDTNYTDAAFSTKKEIVAELTKRVEPLIVCDLGANRGDFSRIFAQYAQVVLSPDIDPVAVQTNYSITREKKEKNIYPLVIDLCNPSPGIGWHNTERKSFLDRAHCDLAAGLALIHHLCIGNNLPLEYVAKLFADLAPTAIVEFVPKGDSQVDRLLSSREDIFPDYTLASCLAAFGQFY
ncbi:MAG: SAM-dependent methyltransferase, partial [Planctomycetia bacterium]|nr:SAM-dependent methyltransferase [Planctomycetia bacterium]